MVNGGGPVVLWDGDCGFCGRWAQWIERRVGSSVRFIPYQQTDLREHGIPRDDLAEAIHLVDSDGRVYRGAHAVLRVHAETGWKGRFALVLYRRLPGAGRLSELVYGWVAAHRPLAGRVIGWIDAADGYAAGHERVARWVLTGIGVVFVAAFVSLLLQLEGLFGGEGLHPISAYVERLEDRAAASFGDLPSLFWLDASDAVLYGVAALGLLSGLAAIAGILRRGALLTAWLCYLSFVTLGGRFLSFQWDALLLEAGFAGLLLGPLRGFGVPSLAGLLWMRWLAFRLVFSSGLVKLSSGDPTWADFSAMLHHFETQPLPNPVAWYAHQLPEPVLRALTGATFALELLVPPLIFLGARPRRWAFTGIVALQVGIALTGNYGFFNLLTVVVALSLLDDDWLGTRVDTPVRSRREPFDHLGRRALAFLLVTVLWAASLVPLIRSAGGAAPTPLADLHENLRPVRVVNGYGLFAVMTTRRPEIVFETRSEGKGWRPLPFAHKPGDPEGAPPVTGLHMPRFDWQLWFAALRGPRRARWTEVVLERLCAENGAVRTLFAEDGMANESPDAVRAVLYEYRFRELRGRAPGIWWDRDPVGLFAGPRWCGREVR